LTAERVLDYHLAFGNEERAAVKGGKIVQFEESIFGIALRFQLTAAADVQGRNATLEECRANHEEAMALERVFLCAH
jgi:hypothetical protein